MTKSEYKDKDLIHALKNSVNKYKSLLNMKKKEINALEIKNAQLDEALLEASEMIKDMAGKMNSSSLVNAMTAPDMQSPFAVTGKSKDFSSSITKSLLL